MHAGTYGSLQEQVRARRAELEVETCERQKAEGQFRSQRAVDEARYETERQLLPTRLQEATSARQQADEAARESATALTKALSGAAARADPADTRPERRTLPSSSYPV
eukprot:TRINITY_DN12125_c0_g1_i10.p6 TRINITY_DN12125_c0_g1~~TRINITY_DN12125_c0_g1_i10.p6  ORF type:complete len:108 (+),score=12.68 TRINITY_DN12125_c0_g1_i10:88-411(+)